MRGNRHAVFLVNETAADPRPQNPRRRSSIIECLTDIMAGIYMIWIVMLIPLYPVQLAKALP